MSVDEIVAEVEEWDTEHVVVTGGEPMLFAELIPLCGRLRAIGQHLTSETAGTLYLPVTCDLMSISPKLASSTPSLKMAGPWQSRHEKSRHAPDVIRRLTSEYAFQLKFVVDVAADLLEIEDYLQAFPQIDRSQVWLMPQGIDPTELATRSAWIEPYCLEKGFTFCPRKHIQWYGAVRGT